MKYLLLDLAPIFFRTKWPMKRFYWQKEDIEQAEKKSRELMERIKWK